MNEIVHHLQLIQVFISACAGFIGVGIGIGVFRNTIKQVKIDIIEIKRKQATLRGENGDLPIFMTRRTCGQVRNDCMKSSEIALGKMCRDIADHTKSIKAFDNFARWWMQKEGLNIDQINQILDNV